MGYSFIERGDYEVMRAENSQIIDRSKFATSLEAGMVVEMCIVMRQSKAFSEVDKCFRCNHLILQAVKKNVWIQWQVPLNFYMLYINGVRL